MIVINWNTNTPYILVISLLLSCPFALGIAWLHYHPLYGRYWQAHAWIEVVIGTLCIDATAVALLGWSVAIPLAVADAVWGLPMILACETANTCHTVHHDDQAEADHISTR